jgi:hypothetical protein
MPEVTDSPPETTAPPMSEDAAYRIFEDSINRRADEIVRGQGLSFESSERVAWMEHGHFYQWLVRQPFALPEAHATHSKYG